MKNLDKETCKTILEEINILEAATAGIDFETFNADEVLKRGVCMMLVNLVELARHLSSNPFEDLIEVRTLVIKGLKHKTIHFDCVWETLKDVGELKKGIEVYLKN